MGAVGQASETDLSQGVSWSPKIRVISQVLEFDEALTITPFLVGGGPPPVTPAPALPSIPTYVVYRRRRKPEKEDEEKQPVEFPAIMAGIMAEATRASTKRAQEDDEDILLLWL